ncbi:MAG: putative cytochrome c [Gemmatimonadetes bacterium]|nr:putative cytochrome c [Gemmatimonadota bacterium]
MHVRWIVIAGVTFAAACAGTMTNVRAPMGANLLPEAKTGAATPLRFDPNAKVILSSAAGLPPASYLPSQAERGAMVYAGTCASCHEVGKFVGPAFVESWKDRRVYDFYALVRSTMPLDNPGGLKEQEYLDVTAYILRANHAPAGTDSLKADTLVMRKTRIAVQ